MLGPSEQDGSYSALSTAQLDPREYKRDATVPENKADGNNAVFPHPLY